MTKTIKITVFLMAFFAFFFVAFQNSFAQTITTRPTLKPSSSSLEINVSLTDSEATDSAILVITEAPTPSSRSDFTKDTEETIGPLEELLDSQVLGVPLYNPIKYAIRASVEVGVPPNTIVLLLMLPAVVALIAAARQLIGIRGFGIFMPAALAVVFLATGPIVGIGFFLVIVAVSTGTRIMLRKTKVKLQYLPRMAMILLFAVIGVLVVLFATPVIGRPDLASVSIFPVLILVLLAEDFAKVQLGKSARVAINLTIETLIIALLAFIFLTLEPVRHFALLHPEVYLFLILIFDFVIGKYVGLRFTEYWRFRKILKG